MEDADTESKVGGNMSCAFLVTIGQYQASGSVTYHTFASLNTPLHFLRSLQKQKPEAFYFISFAMLISLKEYEQHMEEQPKRGY